VKGVLIKLACSECDILCGWYHVHCLWFCTSDGLPFYCWVNMKWHLGGL